MKRPAVLAAAAALYATAAFAVPPGFFDGFTQQVPYRFVKPPPCCTWTYAAGWALPWNVPMSGVATW